MKPILPAPVLAEPESRHSLSPPLAGEARESTENCDHTGEGSRFGCFQLPLASPDFCDLIIEVLDCI